MQKSYVKNFTKLIQKFEFKSKIGQDFKSLKLFYNSTY